MTSDASRALETAALVNISLCVPLVHDACLREQNWGQWTGKTVAQLKEEAPLLLAEQERAGWKFCPPGGEDRNAIWERAQRALKGARGKWPGEKILVITHEGVITCLIYRLYGRQFLPTELPAHTATSFPLVGARQEGAQAEGDKCPAPSLESFPFWFYGSARPAGYYFS